MTIDAITLGGAFMPQLFPLPDSSGLKPLVLPDVILSNPSSGNDEPPSRSVPSPDAVDRFQKAISTPIPSISRLVATIAAAPQQQQAPAPQASSDISASQPIVVEPRPTIVEPPIAVVEPKTTIVEPKTTIVEPQVAVVEPKVAVVEPKTTIVEPKIAIAEPQAATARPQATQITKPENADLPSVAQGPKVENVPNGVFSANSPAPAIKIPEPTKAEDQATGNELRALDSGLQLQTPEAKSPELVAKATPSPEHADLSAVKVQDPKIETVENRPSIAEPATLQADKPIQTLDKTVQIAEDKPVQIAEDKPIQVAEDKPVQATDRPIQVVADKTVQTADKPVQVAEGNQASAIERQTVNVDRQPAAIERQTTTVERKNPNVEIQIDLAESPKTDGVVIPAAVPFAQDAPVVHAASATIEIDPSAATARTSELTEAASAVAKTISVTPALSRGDGEVVIRLKPTVLDGSEIRVEAKGSTITIDISPATAEVAQIIERSQAQFAQQLSERMPSFQFTVATTPRQSYVRKATTNETT